MLPLQHGSSIQIHEKKKNPKNLPLKSLDWTLLGKKINISWINPALNREV